MKAFRDNQLPFQSHIHILQKLNITPSSLLVTQTSLGRKKLKKISSNLRFLFAHQQIYKTFLAKYKTYTNISMLKGTNLIK